MKTVTQLFTFGCGQTFANCFVSIESDTADRCRQIMFDTFGEKWCMQYNESEKEDLEFVNMKHFMSITELEDRTLITEVHEAHIRRL